jgi:hypothetical protein
MTGTPVNGSDVDLTAFYKGLPAAKALAEAAILQELIGVFLADIAKAVLPSDRGRLEKQNYRQ